jgi:hypothetical protein
MISSSSAKPPINSNAHTRSGTALLLLGTTSTGALNVHRAVPAGYARWSAAWVIDQETMTAA